MMQFREYQALFIKDPSLCSLYKLRRSDGQTLEIVNDGGLLVYPDYQGESECGRLADNG
jgi:hypothetical protein